MSAGGTSNKRLAALLPDVPRWVELRSMLLRGDCEVTALSESPALSLVARDIASGLVCVCGEPVRDAIRAAANDGREVITPPESADHVASALPGWLREDAVLHLLGDSTLMPVLMPAGRSGVVMKPFIDPEALPVPADRSGDEMEVRFVSSVEVDKAGLPGGLNRELMIASLRGQVAATVVAGKLVSFCYAGAVTETLFDVSIDTLEPYRRRGYAGLCVAFLVDHIGRERKRPVWGAHQSNVASLRLAARLGFTPVDRVVVFGRG